MDPAGRGSDPHGRAERGPTRGDRGRTRRLRHSESYVGLLPAAWVHRARLARLRALLKQLNLPNQGVLLDLGCSDGFIIDKLRADGVLPTGWEAVGFDARRRHVREARQRHLSRTRFKRLDLNDPAATVGRAGDVVICLETLEHVGDYRAALQVLHNALRPGGHLILSMPNEVGAVGLVKLFGRLLYRRRPYRGFFSGRKQVFRYVAAVGKSLDLESFRHPPRGGWGPHRGFDPRAVAGYVGQRFVAPGLWAVERVDRSAFGANRFLVIRRVPEQGDDRQRSPHGS